MRRLAVFVVLLSLSGALRAASALSPDEQKKQNDFKKAYSTSEMLDRVKSLEMLDGAEHPSTWQILAIVASSDQAKEVRLAAFKMLSKVPAHDPGVAHQLCAIFGAIKPMDIEQRLEFIPPLANSEYRFEIISMLVEMGSKMRYPDLVNGAYANSGGVSAGVSGGAVGNVDPNIGIKKLRDHFSKFLTEFNLIAKSEIKEPDKDSPMALKKWWDAHGSKVLAADKELTEKYRAEEHAANDKINPLVPKAAEKK